MANFENRFYENLATKVDEQKLPEKFHVAYTPEGSTPDGYYVYESLTIETGKGAVSIGRGGEAVFQVGLNETEPSMTEAYTMIGIDTDSKEFKQFQNDIQKPENYNVQTVEKMLETVPQLTAEKQVEKLNNFSYENEREQAEFKHNFVNSEIVKNLVTEVEAKGFTKEHEAYDVDYDSSLDYISDTAIENHFDNQLKDFERSIQKTKTELAEPGRQYTGQITAIDEEKTVQQTKSGVTVIHETKNLPGIERQEVGQNVKIDYSNGKEATIEEKSSGLERTKETKMESQHQAEKSHDNDKDYDVPF